ncbi:Signal transduction protein [Candidatus Terasakiella magnetica]|uniref:phosphoenolpyruvate--protein phosphotransferase n=1 Tax=Candidatus Terasakiella magnetica TaxID=1867952 RepID=A0A1C3RFN6_9PROT|nr:phosphoenolpyruvate--protein phosphotransferase [Candidatus Terasakiella magnetica]SCA56068.1 Signal transduction protein [Candidatus Terasakiella magnetica]
MIPGRTHAAPMGILSRLRSVMQADATAETRLQLVTNIVATDLVAEVCSIYIMRAGEVLELFATKGLKTDAVHLTRLRVGEGIVGTIAASARPLNLSEAQSHPEFAYRPETGEELYHSMMGVPIVRASRVLGVMVIQNKTKRHYTDEEVETLQTVAMIISELVGGGELVNKEETLPTDGIAMLPLRLEGNTLNVGLGMGEAVLHEPRVVITQFVAEDPEAELERLRQALSEMHGALDDMLQSSESLDDEHRDILETYRMFAEDAGWLGRIREAIKSGLTAEAAVQKVHDDTEARMAQVQDPYLRERVNDLQDLANRLLQHLVGVEKIAPDDIPEHAVLIGTNMGPAELLDYDRTRLRALVLEEGSATSHVAIIARALDIPVIGQVKKALARIEAGDPIVVDGNNNQVFIRPGDDVLSAFKQNVKAREKQKAVYASLRDKPAVTKDGVEISLNVNAGLLVDLEHLKEVGADGVGLYRTEIPFMARSDIPGVESQVALYRKIMDEADGKPVVFRTLDAGGDKVLPYWDNHGEENPAMGWRAIRVTLDRPYLLRQQLRSLIRACGGRELNVMFPMVAEVSEFMQAKRLLDMEIERESIKGHRLPSRVNVGVMLEVPSLLFQMDCLLDQIDFLSVGSNDLFQFLFASDRGNPRISSRYDTLSPAVLNALSSVVKRCHEEDVVLSLCGEMGGRPLDAMALVGIGFRKLSMTASAVGPVKMMIRSLTLSALEDFMKLQVSKPKRSLRAILRQYAKDRDISV